MRTEELIKRIADVRRRQSTDSAAHELTYRLISLERAYKKFEDLESELTRYFPVAIISCVEGYFRMVIRELIDAGDPYFANAKDIVPSMKWDFSLLRAVHGRSVTVGEIVAHAISISRLEHIDKALSCILNQEFLAGIRTAKEPWEENGKPTMPMLSTPDLVFATVARTFELRHIICHEIGSVTEFEPDEIRESYECCVAFLGAAEAFITQIRFPDAPLDHRGMEEEAGRSLRDQRGNLEKVLGRAKLGLRDVELVEFDNSQKKWEEYCNAWAAFTSGLSTSDGSIRPMLFAYDCEKMVAKRIEEITDWQRRHDTPDSV